MASSTKNKKASSKVQKKSSNNKRKNAQISTNNQEVDTLSHLSVEKIQETYNNIQESTKKYNDILKLINWLEEYSLSTEEDKEGKTYRFLILSLFKIFERLISENSLRNSTKKESDEKKIILNKWLKNNYLKFKQLLLNIIQKENENDDVQIDCLEIYMKLMKLETRYWAPPKNETYFPADQYEKLIDVMFFKSENGKILPDGTNNDLLVEFFNKSFLKNYKDLKFYFLSAILNFVSKNEGEVFNNENRFVQFFSKWLTLMQEDFFHSIFYGNENKELKQDGQKAKKSESEDDLDDVFASDEEDDEPIDAEDDDEFDENDDQNIFVENPPVQIQKYVLYKSLFSKCWIEILKYGDLLNENQLKTSLKILHKRVIPYLMKPEHLMDFLTNCYDNKDQIIVQILAINGLFHLINKYNLQYPAFFEKFYQFFNKPEILTNKYRSRFFRMADLFLSYTHLPSNIMASFIKRLARLLLFSNPGAIVIVIPFIYNLLKRHPKCMILIHNPFIEKGTEEAKLYHDPFNNNEKNPMLSNAMNSSLWELQTLSTHYHPNVGTLAKIFSNPFNKQSYNIEDFLDWSYNSLLQTEKTRKIKQNDEDDSNFGKGMALEYDTWDLIFFKGGDKQDGSDDQDAALLAENHKKTYMENWSF